MAEMTCVYTIVFFINILEMIFLISQKKYYANEDASQWFDEWGTGYRGLLYSQIQYFYYREREDYFARNNYRIMRYADVLLSYAECLVETGTSASDAAVYVDKVRERAGLSKLKDSRWKDCLSSKGGLYQTSSDGTCFWNFVSKAGVGRIEALGIA